MTTYFCDNHGWGYDEADPSREYNPEAWELVEIYSIPLTPEQAWTKRYHELVSSGQMQIDFDMRDLALFSDLGVTQ